MNGMNEELIVIAVDQNFKFNLKYDLICKPKTKELNFTFDILPQFRQWIDQLGEESAKAQLLKQSITSFDRLIDDKTNDKIYLLMKLEPNVANQWSAVGFVRIGTRNLWFADKHNESLRQVLNCFCVLDFYIRNQRHGFGHFLISKVIRDVSQSAAQFAYDKPTKAMIAFLGKHFGLNRPVPQHNRFVIFDAFCFDKYINLN